MALYIQVSFLFSYGAVLLREQSMITKGKFSCPVLGMLQAFLHFLRLLNITPSRLLCNIFNDAAINKQVIS